jgi:deoxyribodipyrimidine photo-lyase
LVKSAAHPAGGTTLLWFGRDLRLTDNPALAAALARGGPVIPIFLLDDAESGAWAPGGASRWWLDASLAALDRDLGQRGSRLILRRGPAQQALDRLIEETGADAVYWNRRYEPWAVARAEKLKAALKQRSLEVHSFNSALLREPWTLKTQQGGPYRVFTPFWKALRAEAIELPGAAAPEHLPAPKQFPASDRLDDWQLRPSKPDWAGGLREAWQPGEAGAQERLADFAETSVLAYHDQRDRPGRDGTSRLSPHLHFGEIGPRQIWRAVTAQALAQTGSPMPAGVETYLKEIAWREFSYHLLFHFPHLPDQPLRAEFADFPWAEDAVGLKAWQRGRTGYPIVDAGMRQLWQTGWMHNRVRMIVASFLIKDLLLPWQAGEAWFWDTLVDADLANNAASWQWVAGSGADPAPYFRVFNPSLQGAKFDPNGTYVRRWVPELAKLPDTLVHAPWTARPVELQAAGIRLGHDYPTPIVDHAGARHRALEAFKTLRQD